MYSPRAPRAPSTSTTYSITTRSPVTCATCSYNLTVEALDRIDASPLSRREIIRRLGTSPAQFYRRSATNYRKSVDKMLPPPRS